MKNKLKYNLTKMKQCESITPQGNLVTLIFEDGRRINVYEGNFIQLLSWLEIDEEDDWDVPELLNRIYINMEMLEKVRHFQCNADDVDTVLADSKDTLYEVAKVLERLYY